MRLPEQKRLADIALAALGLVLSSPLWLAITLAVLLEDPGPVFFFQERCGKDGTRFRLAKFRTMWYRGGTRHRVMDIENDPRVTKVGRLLRATAMDELPALLSILKGDMSFVGPRPLPFEIESEQRKRYENISEVPGYRVRAQVRPGLTGLAAVYAPKSVDHRTRFRYDALYVRRSTCCLDLKLILLSFRVSLRGNWERRERKI